MIGRGFAVAALAAWAGAAQVAAAAPGLTLENQSSRRIEGVTLANPVDPKAASLKAAGFLAERDGGDAHVERLTPHMRGRPILPEGVRVRCVFDVTVSTTFGGAVHRRGLDLCRHPSLTIDNKMIEYPPVIGRPPPPIVTRGSPSVPAPPLIAPDAPTWTLVEDDGQGGRTFLDPGSIAGPPEDRRVMMKSEQPGVVYVEATSFNCALWERTVLAVIRYDTHGRQIGSDDLKAEGSAYPGQPTYGSAGDRLMIRLCQGLLARLR